MIVRTFALTFINHLLLSPGLIELLLTLASGCL